MSKEAIERTRYFSLQENWGDPDKVHDSLIFALDLFRRHLGRRVHLSPVEGAVYAESGHHSDMSWHYIIPGRNDYAMAADVFPEGNIIEAWLIALTIPHFVGIGLYPFWKWESKGLKGGLHLDIRYLGSYDNKALWWCDLYKVYKSLDMKVIFNLYNVGVL